MSGAPVATLREGDEQIPVVARLRMEERAQLVGSPQTSMSTRRGTQKVPLQSVSSIVYEMQTEKLQRRNQFRTVTISAFPAAGTLPSEVLGAALPQLEAVRSRRCRPAIGWRSAGSTRSRSRASGTWPW